jgi:cell division protein FtsI (penicillin-binding protein 3)|tara:strand:- start:4933 stop:7038 length:2106 start_codon:yes stop_codon:yes gene_type:complete
LAERGSRKHRKRRGARAPGSLFAHLDATDAHGAAAGLAWRQTMRRRVLVVAVGLALWTAGIETRLLFLQVWQFDDMVARAERQQLRTVATPAKRGEVLDRHGRVLAVSAYADSIYAVPAEISEPERIGRLLCEALEECSEAFRDRLVERLRGDRAFAYVRRQVSPREAARVADLGLDGVGFLKEHRRFYPNRELAAHVLGYVGIDNQGLHGIESTYDEQIRGRPGQTLIQTDARRRAFSRLDRPPTSGATLELTIDEYLQHIAERELRAAVETHDADGGTIIILDPLTGEMLALANEPTFNPNDFAASTADTRRNRAIQEIYEPGSTFKIVTASAALQERIVEPDDPIDVSAGMIRFGSRQIDDFVRYDTLSFADVIVKSSNVGAIKVALQVGPGSLDQYVRRFGFGRTLSPDFRGESAGIVWDPARLNDSALASVAIGYQVAVTPLQMAAAASVIANGGELIEPRIVRAVRQDGQRIAVTPRVLGRAVTSETAATITTIMEDVAKRGTARRGAIPGYSVAGKTGTSAKVVDGAYSQSEYNASFVGFVPSRDPVFTVLVVINAPHGEEYTGGAVAAPVFKRVAESALRHRGVPPSVQPASPIIARRRGDPLPPVVAPAVRPVLTSLTSVGQGPPTMPDLRGLSARQALRALAHLSMVARLHGDGVVVAQQPGAGDAIESGMTSVLQLSRRPTPAKDGELDP